MGEWYVYASLLMRWTKHTRTKDNRPIKMTVYQLLDVPSNDEQEQNQNKTTTPTTT